MMFLLGKGGEGKSRIGLVLKKLMGDAVSNGSIQKVETSRFARADLENRLLMVDDDLNMNALPKTNYIKSIMTAEAKMDVERKAEISPFRTRPLATLSSTMSVKRTAIGTPILSPSVLHGTSISRSLPPVIPTCSPNWKLTELSPRAA